MNTQSNAAPLFRSATQPFYWSVRRELWEFRSIYLAPFAVACVALFGFLIATIGRGLAAQDLAQRREIIEEPPDFAALLIMLTTFIVAVFYCLDALHGERRDRSILFWKSLPVSDLTAVLAKATVPLVVLPLITFAITFVMQWIMLLLSTAVLLGSGLSVAGLWTHSFEMWLMLLYHLLAVHSLWYAPIYAWLLLISAWARRAPFLWASLPLLAIGIFEKIAFNTTHFGAMLGHRFAGGSDAGPFTTGSIAMDPLMQLTPGRFLMSPGLWIGFAITAAFLTMAVRLRRYRGPI